jgi:hypothetical protein
MNGEIGSVADMAIAGIGGPGCRTVTPSDFLFQMAASQHGEQFDFPHAHDPPRVRGNGPATPSIADVGKGRASLAFVAQLILLGRAEFARCRRRWRERRPVRPPRRDTSATRTVSPLSRAPPGAAHCPFASCVRSNE